MATYIVLFCVLAIFFRVASLAISVRHAAALKKSGAVEIGRKNSTVLATTHVLYYVSSMLEAVWRPHDLSPYVWLGLFLYVVGMLVLASVIRLLGPLWTVKLLIARDHTLIQHPLFRWFRHPNYFLNILPELTGLALVLNAHVTLFVGLVIYAIPLTIRIRQEEAVMRARFTDY
ncbi:isoprenylcysteine carboxylmethyltransferase family protein [Rhizobium sp. BE258]|uniref:isoprenylcysteine carboxylmethyltransferase family protein n=1 Tax=Rhizobium sp. BE258 TaxID=2817722 RepID=UPI002857B9E1|nr:isoprenylcysteine carboxylmethyltransferase family protein [Rhizobium sp. BE258]MDR7147778.1 isoprenylcysteine carboxyl methyltransferase (ICMT) family protein YpbQ [Rhizobium sp. BE258]